MDPCKIKDSFLLCFQKLLNLLRRCATRAISATSENTPNINPRPMRLPVQIKIRISVQACLQ